MSFAGVYEATGGYSQRAMVKPRTPHSSVGEQCGRHFHSLNRKAQRTSALQSLGAERNGGCEPKCPILLSTSLWKLSPVPVFFIRQSSSDPIVSLVRLGCVCVWFVQSFSCLHGRELTD